MKLPRFRLATILLACAQLSFFLGANLCIRTLDVVEFLPADKLQEPNLLTKSSLYAGHYRSTESWIGWPATLAQLSRMSALVDVFATEPISDAEKYEIQVLARNSIYLSDSGAGTTWNAAEFRRLAPLIYHGLLDLSETDKKPRPLIPEFMTAPELLNTPLSLPALALNIAVALAITLACAALCEFLLRRRSLPAA